MKFFLTFASILCLALSVQATEATGLQTKPNTAILDLMLQDEIAKAKSLRSIYALCCDIRKLPKEEYFAWAHAFETFNDMEAVADLTKNLQSIYFRRMNLSPYAIEDLYANFPKTNDLYNTLAWAHYLSEQDATNAYQMIQKVEQFDNHSRDTNAMILLRMGKPAEALQQILPVISEFRFTEGGYYTLEQYYTAIIAFSHAGDIFYRNNLYQEAFLAWGKAYNLVNSLIQQQLVTEDALLPAGYNHQQTRAKLRALKKRHNLFNDVPEA